MDITPFYAAALGLLFAALSVRALRMRRRLRIAIGDSNDERMLRATRVHANFAEYAPLGLLLIWMLEMQGIHDGIVHLLCTSLLLGRLSHAYGVSKLAEDYRYRVFGMAMTLAALVGAASVLLLLYASRLIA